MFNLCYNPSYSRGFSMKFDNGWSISVQWGAANYCENRPSTDGDLLAPFANLKNMKSEDCEIAFIDPDGRLHYMPEWSDQVKGYVSPNDLITYIIMCAAFDSTKRATPYPSHDEED